MKIVESFKYDEISGFKFGYLPMGTPKLFSHIYFIDGLLIDTGHSKMRKSIVAEIQYLDVEQIFITHHHEDHTGNIPVLKEQFDCHAFASEACCQLMQQPPPISFAQKMVWGDRAPYPDLLPKDNHIETKHYRFDIIPVPGHAPDMVALYEPNKRWLFSADLYVNSYIGYFLASESMAQQIQSIRSILALDFTVMFCGHNPQLKNGKQQLKQKLVFLESFFHDVAKLYEKGYAAPDIFRRLQLRENRFVKLFSGGKLSKINMVRSVIRDLESGQYIPVSAPD